MVDRTITEHTCFYCGRAGTHRWPSGRYSCGHEVCESLAYGRDVGFVHRPEPQRRRRLHVFH